jgi:hypothetical protein
MARRFHQRHPRHRGSLGPCRCPDRPLGGHAGRGCGQMLQAAGRADGRPRSPGRLVTRAPMRHAGLLPAARTMAAGGGRPFPRPLAAARAMALLQHLGVDARANPLRHAAQQDGGHEEQASHSDAPPPQPARQPMGLGVVHHEHSMPPLQIARHRQSAASKTSARYRAGYRSVTGMDKSSL